MLALSTPPPLLQAVAMIWLQKHCSLPTIRIQNWHATLLSNLLLAPTFLNLWAWTSLQSMRADVVQGCTLWNNNHITLLGG
jgi:hypothetical protein